MEELKEIEWKYNFLVKKRDEQEERLNYLAANFKEVKEYIELLGKKTELDEAIEEMYPNILKARYKECEHVIVSCPPHSGNEYKGCIKCGLVNRKSLNGYIPVFDTEFMREFYKESHIKELKGKELNVECNLKLAKAIYKRIKKLFPNISDELATKYFEIALDNIKNIEVSEERQENRANRLGLCPSENLWK